MSFQDSSAEAEQKLTNLSSLYPDQAEFYSTVTALLQSKLYHQLTVAILDFTSNPANAFPNDDNDQDNFLQLYLILTKLKSKLNPLMLARIACSVSQVQQESGKKDSGILADLLETDELLVSPRIIKRNVPKPCPQTP